MKIKALMLFCLTMVAIPAAHASYAFTNLVGNPGGIGNADGTGLAARFNFPHAIAIDTQGNAFVADTQNHTIRKITLAGVVSTIAGTSGLSGFTDGTGSAARFYAPTGIAVDGAGNVYVADYGNSTIRKLSPAGTNYAVKTLAGTAGVFGKTDGAKALFSDPFGVAVDGSGDVYVSDTGNASIRRITPNGVVSTVVSNGYTGNATNGFVTNTYFYQPRGLCVDAYGNIFVADSYNGYIKEVTPGGQVTTYLTGYSQPMGVAVDPYGTVYVANTGNNQVRNQYGDSWYDFDQPMGVAVDANDNVYVADTGDQLIQFIPSDDQDQFTLAGSEAEEDYDDGFGTDAYLNSPSGIAINSFGVTFVADTGNQAIRSITPDGYIGTFAGGDDSGYEDGPSYSAVLEDPAGLVLTPSGNLLIADYGFNRIQVLFPNGNIITYNAPYNYNMTPYGLAMDASSNLYIAEHNYHAVFRISPSGDVFEYNLSSHNFAGIAVDSSGNAYVADDTDNSIVKFAPDGSYTYPITNSYTLSNPQGVVLDASNNLYIADEGNDRIAILYTNGNLSNFVGNIGVSGTSNAVGTNATFDGPIGIALDAAGNAYVVDNGSGIIRKVTPGGVVTTIAGYAYAYSYSNAIGTNAKFYYPEFIAVDSTGSNIWVSDTDNDVIRKVTDTGSNWVVTTVAGIPNSTSYNSETFNSPLGVAVDGVGDVFVADTGNNAIRKIAAGGIVSTAAGGNYVGAKDGPTNKAQFYYPAGVAVNDSGTVIYVADTFNHTIRLISNGVVSTYAGSAGLNGSADGTGAAAQFWAPTGIVVDSSNNVFVADTYNNTIRQISPGGVVKTIAGSPTKTGNNDGSGNSATFNHPAGLAIDQSSGTTILYVADSYNQTIRSITLSGKSATVATVGGTPGVIGGGRIVGYDGIGPAAEFDYPLGVAVDIHGNVSVADTGNNRISEDAYTPNNPTEDPASSSSIFASTTPKTALSLPDTTPANGLVLLTNGSGSITHGAWPAKMVATKKYTVSATPAAGSVFTGWVGGTSEPYTLLSTSPKYTFPMQAGLVLEANFSPNPFAVALGVYNGLFSLANVTEDTAGMVKNLVVTKKGTYTGSLLIAGAGYPFSGTFSLAGTATNVIKRSAAKGGPLTISLSLTGSSVPLTLGGSVSGSDWTAPLSGVLASKTVPAGAYSLTILPDDAASGSPTTNGTGFVIARSSGAVLSATLADKTKLSESTAISADGSVAVYANLYRSQGLVLGWVNLDTTNGSFAWVHPALSTGIYKDAFTSTNAVQLAPVTK